MKDNNNSTDVYIFGAGASRAEIQEMPLMNDFFKTLADKAKYEEDDLWRCLAILDYLRLFKHRHTECENLAAQILMLRGQRKPGNLLKKKVIEYIRTFRKRFKDDSYVENLEEVFEKAIYAQKVYKQTPRHRLLAAVNRLFQLLVDEKNKSFPVHSKLVKKILSKKRKSILISFNYDLILDKVLFNLASWGPKDGYGYEFKEIPNKNIRNLKSNKSNILLLKPHGSLSWRQENNLGFDSQQICTTVDNKGVPTSGRYYDKTLWKNYHILVVPPISAKLISHPILYETRRKVKLALKKATNITIVGWSLPETDVDMVNMIHHIFDDIDVREKQLNKLTVIDYNLSKNQLNRINSIFMAKDNKHFNKGLKDYVLNKMK